MNRDRLWRRNQSERIKRRNLNRAKDIFGYDDIFSVMCKRDVRSGKRFFFAGDTIRKDKMWQLILDYKFQRSLPI